MPQPRLQIDSDAGEIDNCHHHSCNMVASMQDKLCLGCSSTVPAQAKPASIFVHSCCSRPVCQSCLMANPRLATFCPICESATSAFNKGPRADVTRAGQIVFDAEKVLNPIDRASSPTAPPPAYSEAIDPAKQHSVSDFVIDDDSDKEDVRDSKTVSRPTPLSSKIRAAPDLLHRHASKSSAEAELDVAANGSSSSSASTRVKVDPFNSTTSQQSSVSHSKLPAKEGDGQTRQYWIQKQDTLQSIAIRFGVSSNGLCLLNALPRSVLSTSPHLLHTRSFILLPAYAVESKLASRPELLQALEGPPQRSAKEKTTSARRGAEARFRALLLRDIATTGQSRIGVETPADEKAARAYIGLAEDEIRHIDFGEGTDKLGLPRPYENFVEGDESHDTMLEAQIDTARTVRFEAILSQAIARWEMDSDWERSQRANGLDPTSVSRISTNSSSGMDTRLAAASFPQQDSTGGWFARVLTGGTTHHQPSRRGLFSSSDSGKCGAL